MGREPLSFLPRDFIVRGDLHPGQARLVWLAFRDGTGKSAAQDFATEQEAFLAAHSATEQLRRLPRADAAGLAEVLLDALP